MKCAVCKADTDIVCSSVCCAPMSHAYCLACLDARREEWDTLVARMVGINKGDQAPWVDPIIEATCSFYNKTESAFWKDVQEFSKEWDQHMLNIIS